jgi:hypothetical protein
MEKYFVVDLLDFFKNRTTEIRHLDFCRHFEFIKKSFSMIFYIVSTKLTRIFRDFLIFSKNFDGFSAQKSIRIHLMLQMQHRTTK